MRSTTSVKSTTGKAMSQFTAKRAANGSKTKKIKTLPSSARAVLPKPAALKHRSSSNATQVKKVNQSADSLNTVKTSTAMKPAPSTNLRLEPKLLVQIHDLMVKARVLEERLTQMYKKSDGYFWIGGPGEEA